MSIKVEKKFVPMIFYVLTYKPSINTGCNIKTTRRDISLISSQYSIRDSDQTNDDIGYLCIETYLVF